jgi:uracil-DNA glycosylase
MNKILLLGEAWGEEEARQRLPFVGPSGWELNRMLEEAGIARRDCYVTNVFNVQPQPKNDIANLCCPKKECGHGLPPISAGHYIRPEYLGELDRLRSELREVTPNVIVALGSTAVWSLTGSGGVSKRRGAVTTSSPSSPVGVGGLKVIPAYHPAAVLRDWSLRHVTVLDLHKALRESEFPDVRRPDRTVFIPESIAELVTLVSRHLLGASRLSIDIETSGSQITCIGFAPDRNVAVVVPFVARGREGNNFWSTPADEQVALRIVGDLLASSIPKHGQNFIYDMNYLWRGYGFRLRNVTDDTMLLHHALHPESPKGLGFLGSVYTSEPAWKLMRKKDATERRSK